MAMTRATARKALFWYVLALFALASPPVGAQTIMLGETKVFVVFYVKEGTNSPYQGLLQMTPEEHAAIKPAELQAKQLKQFDDWKASTEAAKNAPVVVPTIDEKVAQVEALRAEADVIAANPAVVAKLAAKVGVKK
jgi:hypothetical protein